MRLVIAEKPSLGRAIAEGLGRKFTNAANGGALESGDLVITWVFGHILELSSAEAYNPKWKSWRQEDLPIKIDNWLYEVKEPKQLKIIANYLKQADEVVHAGDPDREGQLLVDEVLQYLKWRGATLRLLPHATDAVSIKKAWAGMKSNNDFKPLFHAGLCRQRSDWLVGINGTRAATQLATTNGALVPIGRVMTPTLSLVVQRDLEIENFVAKEFWKVAADVKTECGHTVRLTHDPKERIHDKALATQLAKSLQGRTVQLLVTKEKRQEKSPLPWHLGDFQREMQKRFGWKLAESLQVLQHLYEKKLVSYPRTECRYLPEEQAGEATQIAMRHAGMALKDAKLGAFERIKSQLKPKPWVYDNKKVAEHHGIIPTLVVPDAGKVGDKEMRAWAAIVEHFCKTLLPNYEYLETTIAFEADGGRTFALSGKAALNWDDSWRCLEPRPEDAQLPAVRSNSGRVVGTELIVGKTTPPDSYTEASLSGDMESVAKYATDERIKAKLKETSGIGTAATRAPTIEKLKRYGMIEEFKKSAKGKSVAHIRSTTFGRQVIGAMPTSLKDAALTATWEDALSMIAGNTYSTDDFMTKIDGYVDRVVQAMRALPAAKRISEAPRQGRPAAPSRSSAASSSHAAGRGGKPAAKRTSTTGAKPASRARTGSSSGTYKRAS